MCIGRIIKIYILLPLAINSMHSIAHLLCFLRQPLFKQKPSITQVCQYSLRIWRQLLTSVWKGRFLQALCRGLCNIIWWQWFDMAIETAISKTIYLKHYAYNLFALEVMTQWTSTADNTLLIYWGRMLYLIYIQFDSIDLILLFHYICVSQSI